MVKGLSEGMAEVIEVMDEAPFAVGDMVYIREIPNMTGLVIAITSAPDPASGQQTWVGLPLDSFELLLPTEEDEEKIRASEPEPKKVAKKKKKVKKKPSPLIEEEVVVAFETKPLFAGAKKPGRKYPPRPAKPRGGRTRCVVHPRSVSVFDVKDDLKPLGFKFDGPSKEWWQDVHDEDIDDLVEEVEALGVVLKTVV